MTVRVKLFAVLRERAGSAEVAVDVLDGATVADVVAAVVGRVPAIAGMVGRSAVAVNLERASGDAVVRAGDEVALLPPVSGG